MLGFYTCIGIGILDSFYTLYSVFLTLLDYFVS